MAWINNAKGMFTAAVFGRGRRRALPHLRNPHRTPPWTWKGLLREEPACLFSHAFTIYYNLVQATLDHWEATLFIVT